MGEYMQKIFFGPPGCGKSYRVRQVAKNFGIEKDRQIETTFHPEYGYGDFVAKLLPKTKEDGWIEYRIHAGPLIKALARAYAHLDQPVLLVIDEINRGNCAQIFGDIFQLLDRNDEGWSEYGVDISDLIKGALEQEMGEGSLLPELVQVKAKDKDGEEVVLGYKLRLPPNLSLIGTMNTSDESVYYMDTAFKRRWDFEYMQWDGTGNTPELTAQKNAKIKIKDTEQTWNGFLKELNDFIATKFKGRSVDDKQVGIWFLKASNLPKFKDGIERRGVVLSEKQVELLKKLHSLYGKTQWKDWKKIIPEGQKTTEWGDDKTPDPKQLNSILKTHYKIDCEDLNLEKADYFARDISNYIFDKNPTTQHNVNIKIEKASSGSKPEIELGAIENKLMFFLWDNVFSRDRRPLHELIKLGKPDAKEPRTFGAFTENVEAFITGVMNWPKPTPKESDGEQVTIP